MYATPQWRQVRFKVLKANSHCAACEAKATAVDHLLSHSDQQAAAVAVQIGQTAPANWRARFYSGPFIALCKSCHSAKTKAEQGNTLSVWVGEFLGKRAKRLRPANGFSHKPESP